MYVVPVECFGITFVVEENLLFDTVQLRLFRLQTQMPDTDFCADVV